jgi:site-specific DNA-cytosine methylase
MFLRLWRSRRQTSIVGSRRRRLTPREASRLQGIRFEPFVDSGTPEASIYAQLGNAVNVGVVKLAASALFQEGGEDWGAQVQQEMLRLIA